MSFQKEKKGQRRGQAEKLENIGEGKKKKGEHFKEKKTKFEIPWYGVKRTSILVRMGLKEYLKNGKTLKSRQRKVLEVGWWSKLAKGKEERGDL